METNQQNSFIKPDPTSRMSILGLLFFLMGAPNMYAFFQRRADNVTYSGGQVPRYALVVLVAMAIAGIVEVSVVGAV
ncbi:MAG: hypothetical protein AAF827_04720 [Cyanobacteria bacterium P01_D01_bin.6]